MTGGDFTFRFNLLPGDSTRDGFVNIADVNGTRFGSISPYDRFRDFNTDGFVNVADVNFVTIRSFSPSLAQLPSGTPMALGFGSGDVLDGSSSEDAEVADAVFSESSRVKRAEFGAQRRLRAGSAPIDDNLPAL